MFLRNNYARFADSLNCSEEILFAIEIVTGESFIREDDEKITENAAYLLWREGGRELEILAAIPTDDAQDGSTVFWGGATFAEFDGEKWNIK